MTPWTPEKNYCKRNGETVDKWVMKRKIWVAEHTAYGPGHIYRSEVHETNWRGAALRARALMRKFLRANPDLHEWDVCFGCNLA